VRDDDHLLYELGRLRRKSGRDVRQFRLRERPMNRHERHCRRERMKEAAAGLGR
jgi:hypothetical protein